MASSSASRQSAVVGCSPVPNAEASISLRSIRPRASGSAAASAGTIRRRPLRTGRKFRTQTDPAFEVRLTRLGNRVDTHHFNSQGDFLRGDAVVYEPHSFSVAVDARHQGRTHSWSYDSFEGRTLITRDVAAAFGIETEIAGPAVLEERIAVYGTVGTDPAGVREIRARFDGAIQSVDVALGEQVTAGARLATVESNESLQSYAITAPIAGIVTERAAAAGEQTAGRRLFTITDTSVVWAELAVFPSARSRVRIGAPVALRPTTGGPEVESTIRQIGTISGVNQSVNVRVRLENTDELFPPGTHVTAFIQVAQFEVPLAVKRSGLQAFRDFTVVYAQIGDEYEVRMLDLGRQDSEWIEVLGGLEPGTRYVTENSFVLKADIEKSGATHDH
jgi:cobalt-zinc-cadmium efflux system membrane fusion protein